MKNKSVLIIEDDEISLLILQNALEMEGYEVIINDDSLKATELFLQLQPDIVIVDLMMPQKSGFELIKELRALCSKTLIISISGNEKYLCQSKILGANIALYKIDLPNSVVDSLKSHFHALNE